MQNDRRRWNEKYRKKEFSSEASAIVRNYYGMAAAGRALDIATGNGRNALFLARRGFTVEAVDIADEALSSLSGRHANLHPVCADLDDFEITESRYHLIVNIRFLSRRLFPGIIKGLAPGGVMIFETYLDPPHGADPATFCRDYLLAAGEVPRSFSSLDVIFYAEKISDETDDPRRVASFVARKPG